MILKTPTEQYKGKIISHFEDEFGNELEDIVMVEQVIIVFTDGTKIKLSPDARGLECYISQIL